MKGKEVPDGMNDAVKKSFSITSHKNKKTNMKNFSKPFSLAAAIAAMGLVASSNAQTTVTIGGAADSGANYVNFDGLSSGSTTAYSTGALTVNFAGNAEAVQGSTDGASVPFLSGVNGTFFGPGETTQANGLDATTYLQAGNLGNIAVTGAPNPGKITFDFSSPQNYFGALVGSVDANNEFDLYSGPDGTGTLITSLTGSEMQGLASGISFGDTGDANGTADVNFNTVKGCESVVATTGTTTKEIDDVAFGVGTVPDTCATLGMLSGVFACIQLIRRKLAK